MAKKVLLCDDEIHILRAAEIKVSRAGYDVRMAHDGQEAWEMIQQDRPDVLVTDLQMPRCDGLELTARIRGNERTRDLPILMLTAKGFETAVRRAAGEMGRPRHVGQAVQPARAGAPDRQDSGRRARRHSIAHRGRS